MRSRLTTGEDIETARDLARCAGFRDPNKIVVYNDGLPRRAAWAQYLYVAKKINDDYMLTIAEAWA